MTVLFFILVYIISAIGLFAWVAQSAVKAEDVAIAE